MKAPREETTYYSIKQVAERLSIPISTARRRVKNLPGIVNVGESGKRKLLRIPRTVFDRLIMERTSV